MGAMVAMASLLIGRRRRECFPIFMGKKLVNFGLTSV
jgi:hypothetical protein